MTERSSIWSLLASVCCALLLLGLSMEIYWPGVSGPDLLDDRSSLRALDQLSSNPDVARDVVFGDTSGLLGRPVAMASFVLERLYLDEGIAGSKKVNIGLHAVNAALFMLLCALLFRYRQVRDYHWLAIVLGGIWLLHPLLVSSVLYAVQRMAMLATFFMLLALNAFVYWRISLIRGRATLLRFVPVPLLLVAGLFTKENAIVLVPVLVLLELFWFRFTGAGDEPVAWLRKITLVLLTAGAAGLMVCWLLIHESVAASYRGRQFSLDERLLSQLRILWDYAGQWFLPDLHRMGLYHDDFIVSSALLEPDTTMFALLAWILVAAVCFFLARLQRGGMIVFAVAWYLVGHSVESTVLPLELYFEHRNYFPAMGLVLLVGSLYAVVVDRWPETGRPLLAFMGLALVLLASMTSSQVQVWSSRNLLTLVHLNGHPESFRANTDMASLLAELGEIEAAHHYSARAFEGSKNGAATPERYGDYQVRDIALSCLAGRPVAADQLSSLGTVNPERPFSSVNTLLTLVRILQDDACPQLDRIEFADRMNEIFLVENFKQRGSANIYSSLAVLENALGRYDMALAYVDRFLAFAPDSRRGLLMKLHFTTALGLPEQANEVIARLQQLDQQGKLTASEQKTLALYLTR